MPPRRAALLLPLALLACARRDPEIALPGRPIGFDHLLPLRLNLAELVLAETDPPAAPGDLGGLLALPPAAAIRQMARDRLFAVGTIGQARFTVTEALLRRDVAGVSCALACRLEILDAAGGGLGFVEASARASMTLPSSPAPATLQRAGEAVLRQALGRLNVEFEFQIRRNLRDWLVDGSLAPAPGDAPGEVVREALPPA